jgi:carbon-monoxide dehydrogenase medium subunit
VRAEAAERAFSGANAPEAAELAAEGLDPPADSAGSADYRRHLARVLTRRALEQASRG